MSSRTIIWVRDALVITLSLYIVFSIAMAPWNNLKSEEPLSMTCETGCAPVINYPEDGYYHHKDSIVFEWNSVSVGYRFTVLNSTGHVFHDENLTGITTSTTNRLPAGNYTSSVYYKGMGGSSLGDNEFGSSIALPAWVDFMKTALINLPEEDWKIPRDLSYVRVDRETGRPVDENSKNSYFELFLDEAI